MANNHKCKRFCSCKQKRSHLSKKRETKRAIKEEREIELHRAQRRNAESKWKSEVYKGLAS